MNVLNKKILSYSLISLLLVVTLAMPAISSAEVKIDKTVVNLKENQFVTLTFHDVRDDVDGMIDRDMYAISTKKLAQYFAWIKAERWQPIRLEDILAARQNKKPLPEKAVLLTFDDGALSSYQKVFPLLKQYDIPAVFAIPTSWINGNTQAAYEAYGEGNLMNWDQMREMQKSNLVEFVSHTDNLHRGIQANPQQNMEPAAIVREYLPQQERYETDAEYEKRIVDDLKKSKQILDKELGIHTKAIFWPYGAVTQEAEELARRAGLVMSFSLGHVASLADRVQTYQRALIVNNPNAEQIHQLMENFVEDESAPFKQRKSFLRVNPSDLQASSMEESDKKLGQMLNQIQALKTNTLLIPVVADSDGDGLYDFAYFPNTQIKLQHDIINRVVWQGRTRISNRVYAELPINLELKQGVSLVKLSTDLLKNNSSLEGIMFDTEDVLTCALENATWSIPCEQKVQQVLDIKMQSEKQAKYHANVSNRTQTSLKFELKTDQLDGFKPLVERGLKNSDFIYLSIDPNLYPSSIDALLKQLKQLSPLQVQRLIVSLDVQPDMTEQQLQKYQQIYQSLRKASVQKIGVNNYAVGQGQQIQHYFYQNLSLNDSPLTYRNPYNLGVNK